MGTGNLKAPNFLEKLIEFSPRIRMMFSADLVPNIEDELYLKIAEYAEIMLLSLNCDFAMIEKSYLQFTHDYAMDLSAFTSDQKYPIQRAQLRKYTTETYSIFLVLSALLTKHRYQIFQLLNDKTRPCKKGLFIGAGTGLECHLLANRVTEGDCFEPSGLAQLPKLLPPHIKLHNKLFAASVQKYDCAFLIEVAEHLKDPFDLIETISKSLNSTGILCITTAIDVPQFDHLYNFKPGELKKYLVNNGFIVRFEKEIPHIIRSSEVRPMNELLLVQKIP